MVNISEEDADDYTCVGVNAGKAFSFHFLSHTQNNPTSADAEILWFNVVHSYITLN